jgi:hypothetical protein
VKLSQLQFERAQKLFAANVIDEDERAARARSNRRG